MFVCIFNDGDDDDDDDDDGVFKKVMSIVLIVLSNFCGEVQNNALDDTLVEGDAPFFFRKLRDVYKIFNGVFMTSINEMLSYILSS